MCVWFDGLRAERVALADCSLECGEQLRGGPSQVAPALVAIGDVCTRGQQQRHQSSTQPHHTAPNTDGSEGGEVSCAT